MKRKTRWLIILLILVLGIILFALENQKSPGQKLKTKKETADLNNNNIVETYVLENGRLTITEDSKLIWQSDGDWWIDNYVLADSNNDGILDINVSLWKSGSFGSSKPFWISKDDKSIKNHFFIYDLVDESVRLVWGSSNLKAPNCEFKIADIDNDGKKDLIVIEGNYLQMPKCKGQYIAFWKWNNWGFSNHWRSEKGNFSNLKIEQNGSKTYITVDSVVF